MSPPPALAAGLLRRYLAWSLDMVVPALAALALCGPWIVQAGASAAAALETLARALARTMPGLPASTAGPLDLARGWLADPASHGAVTALAQAITTILVLPAALTALLALAWFAGFEASPRQATPGKRALDLRVVDARGARIGLGRAVLRHLAGTLSWLGLNLGHLLAALPPRHQALHDRIAGTRVLQDLPPRARLPAWSIAWLGVQVALSLGAGAGLVLAVHQAVERAFGALV